MKLSSRNIEKLMQVREPGFLEMSTVFLFYVLIGAAMVTAAYNVFCIPWILRTEKSAYEKLNTDLEEGEWYEL